MPRGRTDERGLAPPARPTGARPGEPRTWPNQCRRLAAQQASRPGRRLAPSSTSSAGAVVPLRPLFGRDLCGDRSRCMTPSQTTLLAGSTMQNATPLRPTNCIRSRGLRTWCCLSAALSSRHTASRHPRCSRFSTTHLPKHGPQANEPAKRRERKAARRPTLAAAVASSCFLFVAARMLLVAPTWTPHLCPRRSGPSSSRSLPEAAAIAPWPSRRPRCNHRW
mmetsp:Transcript_146271/g.469168  ORF Transcript_146271/g.469168 Transcript_146271/m.469168 type:complete len:222 (-) Transcript_146271:305-970(-)